MTPLVSVIIPCYNRSDDLQRALGSVVRQTFTEFEVVVADDASTEDLAAVVDGFADPRIKLVRRSANGGIGAARNTAVLAARGTYLSFLDSDDEWLPTMLETQLRALTEHALPVAAVTTGFEMHYASGRRELRRPAPGPDLLTHIVRGVDLSAGSTMMIRADAWRTIGPWSEDVRRYEDYEWFLRFARRYSLVAVPDVACVIHANDRSALDVAVSRRSAAAILDAHGAQLGRRLRRRLQAMFAQEVAWAAWRSGDGPTFARNLVRALALDPVYRAQVLGRALLARVQWRLGTTQVTVKRRPGAETC